MYGEPSFIRIHQACLVALLGERSANPQYASTRLSAQDWETLSSRALVLTCRAIDLASRTCHVTDNDNDNDKVEFVDLSVPPRIIPPGVVDDEGGV